MTKRHLLQRLLDAGLFLATAGAVVSSFISSLPEWVTLCALLSFVGMFFVRWWLDDDRKAWMKANWFDLALVVLLSSPVLRMLMAFRVAGLAPALRLGTMIRANRERLMRLIILSGESLPAAMAMIFALVFAFGTAAYALEHGHNSQFAHIQDGLWWAFVTLTTVGYGDVVPATSGGRIVAVLTMVFGIAVYSLLIANLTAFIEVQRQQSRGARQGDEEKAEKKQA